MSFRNHSLKYEERGGTQAAPYFMRRGAIHAARQFIKKREGVAFPFLVESGKRKEESDGVGRADGL